MDLQIGKYEGVTSPLDLIDRIRRDGDFIPVGNELSPGEEVIGEMNDEEKAIWTALEMLRATGNMAVDLFRGAPGDAERELVKLRVVIIKRWHAAVKELFWMTMHARFDSVSNIGLADEYQVIKVEEEKDDPLGRVLRKMEALFAGGVKAGKPDCANCDSYDGCTYPFRKTPEQITAERVAAGA